MYTLEFKAFVLAFKDTSTILGYFVLSPREMKATKQNKHPPLPLYTCCKDDRPCPAISQYQLGAPVTRVDNVSQSHVIFMIRDTDFRKEIPSLQVRILPRVPHRNNRAKTVKAVTTHWFLVLFACFVFS